MSDDDKWYTYPEDEGPEQQSPDVRQRKMLVLGVLIGMGITFMMGVVAFLLFTGGGEIALPSLSGLPRSVGMPGILFVLIMVLVVVKIAGSRSTRIGSMPQYPRHYESNPAARIIIVLVIGLIVLALGVLMFYMQL